MAAAAQADVDEMEKDKYFVSGETIELPSAIVKPLLKEFKDAEKAYKEAKQRFDDAKTAIAEKMNFTEVLVVEETDQVVVENRVVSAMVLDTAALKKAHPEITAKFQRERRSRSVRVLV